MDDIIENMYEYFIGATCEVYTTEKNEWIYFGTIQKYDTVSKELDIYTRAEDNLRTAGLIYYTPVKLLVHGKKLHNQIVVLYGHVLRCAEDYLGIELNNIITHEENRGSFRVKTNVETKVQLVLETNRLGGILSLSDMMDCQLFDISLSGIGFSSDQNFRIGDSVIFPNLRLETSLHPYELRCTIQRKESRQDITKPHIYGAVFRNMTENQEDMLCRDIFMIQAKQMKRN